MYDNGIDIKDQAVIKVNHPSEFESRIIYDDYWRKCVYVKNLL